MQSKTDYGLCALSCAQNSDGRAHPSAPEDTVPPLEMSSRRYTATQTSRSTEIERLMLLVEKLQRRLFGTKSEKVLRQIEQLENLPKVPPSTARIGAHQQMPGLNT